MYLSQLILNPLDPQARADMSNPYAMHVRVMAAFPPQLPEGERVLFRLEPPSRISPAGNVLLVQSRSQPDWSMLAGRRRYLLQDPLVREIPALVFEAGQVLRFRLCANPVKRATESRRRVALLEAEERLAWLARKGLAAGFSPIEDTVIQRTTGPRSFKGLKKKTGGATERESDALTIHMVQFDGLLRVTNPTELASAVQNGIGPAKGFGCGLLSLARAG